MGNTYASPMPVTSLANSTSMAEIFQLLLHLPKDVFANTPLTSLLIQMAAAASASSLEHPYGLLLLGCHFQILTSTAAASVPKFLSPFVSSLTLNVSFNTIYRFNGYLKKFN
ncbi:unnamed protein product [Orchesella dallaii]|uniref:Uncharacterized protein n=1 Tax=Orchesella dallaii TaxID=48710 RepID=A0ABP1S5S1_9HEXA